MTLINENQVALYISSNLVFHERTKHYQLADIFPKSLREPRIDCICNKFDTCDLYAPM